MRNNINKTTALLWMHLLLASSAVAEGQRVVFMDTKGPTATVRKLLFTPDGKRILSVGEDKCVRVWDAANGKELGTITGAMGAGGENKLFAAALSPKGDILATAGELHRGPVDKNDWRNNNYVIRLINLKSLDTKPFNVSMQLLGNDPAAGHTDTITALAFSSDGKWLASAAQNQNSRLEYGNIIKLWDMNHPDQAPLNIETRKFDGPFSGLAFSPDGGRIAASFFDGAVYVFDVQHPDKPNVLSEATVDLHQPKSGDQYATSVAWSPDGAAISVTYTSPDINQDAGHVALWAGNGYQKLASLSEAHGCTSVAFSPDSSRMLVTRMDGHSLVWDWKNQTAVSDFSMRASMAGCGAFNPATPSAVAIAQQDPNQIILWNSSSRNGSAIYQTNAIAGTASSAAWSPDGSRLRWDLTSYDGQKRHFVLDLTTASISSAKQADLAGSGWTANRLKAGTVSVDPSTLVKNAEKIMLNVGSDKKEIQNRVDLHIPHDTILSPSCISLTDDGKYAVLGSLFNLAVYDTAITRGVSKPNYLLVGHTGSVTSVAVSPSNQGRTQFIASTSTDGTVRLWSLQGPRAAGDGLPSGVSALAPVATIFAGVNGEWVIWSSDPSGYYTASPQFDTLAVYSHFDSEDGKLSQDDAFQSGLAHPEFFTTYLRKLDINEAYHVVVQTTKENYEAAPVVQYINAPTPTADGKSASCTFRLSMKHSGSVHWAIADNGRIVYDGKEELTEATGFSATVTPNVPVPLQPGENHITVTVDSNGMAGSQPASTVTPIIGPPAQKGNLWVLAIGISEYKEFVGLSYPNSDATAIVDCLKKQGNGSLYGKVAAATALTDKNATKQKIFAAFDNLSQATNDDTVIVFIAGHGGEDEQKNYYFLPYDADTQSLKAVQKTTIKWTDLRDRLLRLPGRVLVFLDTCHSGGVPGNGAEAYSAYYNVLRDLQSKSTSDQLPALVFASCKADQVSHEAGTFTDAKGNPVAFSHGAFTYALLQALSPTKDNPAAQHGKVTPDDLNVFLHSYINKYCKLIEASSKKPLNDLKISPTDAKRIQSGSTRLSYDQLGWNVHINGGNGFTPGDYSITDFDEDGFIVLNGNGAGIPSSKNGSAIVEDLSDQDVVETGFVGDYTGRPLIDTFANASSSYPMIAVPNK